MLYVAKPFSEIGLIGWLEVIKPSSKRVVMILENSLFTWFMSKMGL